MDINFIELLSKKHNDLKLKGIFALIYKLDNYWTYRGILKSLRKMDIRNNPPSFKLLWSFSIFIKYLELVYLYTGPVYTIGSNKEDQNSFVIHKKDSYKIVFNLNYNTENIGITINREHGVIQKTVFNVTPEFKIENDIDAELFLFLEKLLVDTMADVLEYAYKNF